jgi:hypothetical protein
MEKPKPKSMRKMGNLMVHTNPANLTTNMFWTCCTPNTNLYSKAAETERAKHVVTVTVREGTKSGRIKLKTKLNAVAIKTELKRTINICSIITSRQLARLLAQFPNPL